MRKIILFIFVLFTSSLFASEKNYQIPESDFFENKDNIYFFETYDKGFNKNILFLTENAFNPIHLKLYAYYETTKKKEWLLVDEINLNSGTPVFKTQNTSFFYKETGLYKGKYKNTHFYALETLDDDTKYTCVSFKYQGNMMLLIQSQELDNTYGIYKQDYKKDDYTFSSFTEPREVGKKYGILARFNYDDVNKAVIFNFINGKTDFLYFDDEEIYEYLINNPLLKYQKKMSSFYYEFIFEAYSENRLVLTDIQNLDIKKLEEQKEYLKKIEKNYVIYNDKYFKKKNDDISNTVEALYYMDNSFQHKNPYGFKYNTYYYNNSFQNIQTIDENTFLVNFTPSYYVSQYPGIINNSYALLVYDRKKGTPDFGFAFKNLLSYEGVYEYYTSRGNLNTIPKFRVIYPESSIVQNEDEKDAYTADEIDENLIVYISNESDFFKNNDPYALSKNCIYKDTTIKNSEPKVLQWVKDGCLYDYSGYIAQYLDYDCIVHLIIDQNERGLLFDEEYEHYYKYEGVYKYNTTSNYMNIVPSFKVFFEKKQ